LAMGFIITLGPVLAIAAFIGLGLALATRGERWQRLALPAWTGVPGLAYFLFHSLHGGVEANWPLPLWPGLVVLGAAIVIAWWEKRPRLTATLVALQIVIGIAVAAVVHVQIFGQPLDLRYDRTNETRGWPAFAAEIEAVAKANGAGWVATSHSYALTGEVATYLRFRGSTLPVRQINEGERWRFLPPLSAGQLAGPALFIGRANAPPAEFADAPLVGTAARRDRFGEIERFGLYLVTGATPAR
jgi:hypothetical protein